MISFGGNQSPTLASLKVGNVKEALKTLNTETSESDAPAKIVINLGSIGKIKNALAQQQQQRDSKDTAISPTLAALKRGAVQATDFI